MSRPSVYHAKNRNVLILDAINYDVLINRKTARAHTKIVLARTPQVGMAGKQENRSVMESNQMVSDYQFYRQFACNYKQQYNRLEME